MATSKKPAATQTEETVSENKGVAVKAENTALALPEELSFLSPEDFAGAGFEGVDSESFALPFLQILQKMSPAVDPDSPAFIDGARAGMLLNTVTQRLYDGKEGVLLIPCAYKRSYIQWGARKAGGGFKAEHTVEEFEALVKAGTAIAVEHKHFAPLDDGSINPEKSDYFADTRTHYFLLVDEETGATSRLVLSLASTQIKASKRLMTMLHEKKIKAGERMITPPSFLNVVRATTVGMQKDGDTWSGIQFELVGLADKFQFSEAKEFYKQFVDGDVAVDHSKAGGAAPDDGGVGEAQEADKF